MSMSVAKIFESGQSQAVRLPKEFRFDTDEVYVSKEGEKVILLPKPKMTWEEFFASAERFPDFDVGREDVAQPPRERELF
ncbi:MAG: type II toxin-antitoxin system VapB family antitoxin [Synergistaceae bacterium]|nr:type II toxin-antitoxin system VapB family antitoxin [Synergistaceae bacterium]